MPGLETFTGDAAAMSTYHYRDPSAYRGRRVLVAGCAVSALEIAVELARLGASRVVVTQRRQRYVLPKFAAGVTLNQQYLPLVAEGRITVRPWMKSIAETTVTFADDSAEDFDGIVSAGPEQLPPRGARRAV